MLYFKKAAVSKLNEHWLKCVLFMFKVGKNEVHSE